MMPNIEINDVEFYINENIVYKIDRHNAVINLLCNKYKLTLLHTWLINKEDIYIDSIDGVMLITGMTADILPDHSLVELRLKRC